MEREIKRKIRYENELKYLISEVIEDLNEFGLECLNNNITMYVRNNKIEDYDINEMSNYVDVLAYDDEDFFFITRKDFLIMLYCELYPKLNISLIMFEIYKEILGINSNQLAKELNFTRQYFFQLEKEKRSLGKETIYKMQLLIPYFDIADFKERKNLNDLLNKIK